MTTIRRQIYFPEQWMLAINLVCIWKQTMLDTWGKANITLRTEKMLSCTQLQLILMNNYWEVVPFVTWCGQLTNVINKLVNYFNIMNKESKYYATSQGMLHKYKLTLFLWYCWSLFCGCFGFRTGDFDCCGYPDMFGRFYNHKK